MQAAPAAAVRILVQLHTPLIQTSTSHVSDATPALPLPFLLLLSPSSCPTLSLSLIHI